jgi:hypothetical protein
MNLPPRDAGIPILTEVISPAAANDFPDTDVAPPMQEEVANLPTSPDYEPFENQALSRLSEHDWQRLERRIRERILRQILARVDSMLEQRIRDSLADVLQIAMEGLTEQIRSGLHQGLDDIISRAISQEITRLQTPKNKLP